jgi:predicted ester cyclase
MTKLLLFVALAALAMGCNTKSESDSATAADSTLAAIKAKDSILDKNKATALASTQAWNTRNLEAASANFVTDVVDYGEGSYKPVKGLDSVKINMKAFMDAFPDVKGENFEVLGDGNKVAVIGDWSGTFKNPMMKMKPTGKSFKLKDVDIYTFNDAGKITEHHSIQSNLTIMVQVGMKMK